MSETPDEAEQSILRYIKEYYSSPDEEAALRCAYGDAARLMDALAHVTIEANRSHGRVTNRGLELGALLKHGADRIWALREKVGSDAPLPVVRFKQRVERVSTKYTGSASVVSVPAAELMAQEAAEAMRATCEAIARDATPEVHRGERYESGFITAPDSIADAIAALAAPKPAQTS